MIKKCCSSINNAINSFKLLSNDYKEVYEILEKINKEDKSEDNIENEKINKIEMNIIDNDKNLKESLLNIGNTKTDYCNEENDKEWWKLFF